VVSALATMLVVLFTVGAREPDRTMLSNPGIRFAVLEKPYVVLSGGAVEAIVVDHRPSDDVTLHRPVPHSPVT